MVRSVVLWSGIWLAIACASSDRNGSGVAAGAGRQQDAPAAGSAGRVAGSGGVAGTAISAGTGGGSGAVSGDAGSVGAGGNGGRGSAGDSSGASGDGGHAGSGVGDGGMGGAAGSGETCSDGPVTLLLLVDSSSSMLERTQSDPSPKWERTREALVVGLQALSPSLNVGMVFFPQVPANTMPCIQTSLSVPFAPLDSQQRESCSNALASTEPDGNTPTYDAYAYAVDQLALVESVGPKVIVLVTDGIPGFELGCVGTGLPPYVAWDDLVTMVDAAHDNGIKTLAIAAPGSPDTHEMLEALAPAGGGLGVCMTTPSPGGCFLNMDESSDIGSWLEQSLAPLSDACTR